MPAVLKKRWGTLGGHRGTRIYGRLDCPAALRAEKKKKKNARNGVCR